ncbi:MAG: ester cyclase [bacterium]|nr:ester cyclase [bacterium]
MTTDMMAVGEHNKARWRALQDTLNRGDFDAMDDFFHPDFEYSNPSRPDLTGYAAWKQSPMANYRIFSPSTYSVKRMVADGKDVWALCNQTGTHSSSLYMGVEPTGRSFDIDWVSIISFCDGKIIKIVSIADVLGKFVQLGVLNKDLTPINPYDR